MQRLSVLRPAISMIVVVDVFFPGLLPPTLLRRSPSAWWNIPAPEQPALNRTWQAFDAKYSPTKTPVADYLESMRPKVFRHGELLF